MNSDEQMGSRGTWLSEEIPSEYFSNHFYGKVALYYWQHPEITVLNDAVVPVAEALTSKELLDIADLIIEDTTHTIEENCGHYKSMWNEPKQIKINDDGQYMGVVGNSSNVIDYLKSLGEDYGGYDNETLQDEIHVAANRYRGEEFAEFLIDMFERESLRRFGVEVPSRNYYQAPVVPLRRIK